jgi:hypothetical protein
MADIYFRSNDLAPRDPVAAQMFEDAIRQAADVLPGPQTGRLACRIVSASPDAVSVQFDLPGWVQVVPVRAASDSEEIEACTISALRWKLGPPEVTRVDEKAARRMLRWSRRGECAGADGSARF